MTKPFIGLALGGGGARGAAHIGVLQELHDADIQIGTIAGTSAGSIIGAMYAASDDPYWVEDHFRKFMKSSAFSGLRSRKMMDDRNPDSVLDQIAKKVKDHYVVMMGLNRESIVKSGPLYDAINYLIPVEIFQELKIPMKVLATDIQSCEDIIHESGNLINALVQSSSIPGFVEPAGDESELSKKADFVIKPDTLGVHWSDFHQFDQLLENGRSAARQSIDSLKRLIDEKNSILYKLKLWFD